MNITLKLRRPTRWAHRLVIRLRCRLKGHRWDAGKYADQSSWAECRCCGERREPIPRPDGCTPVWDAPWNAYKCEHSSHPGAKSWGGKCPAHSSDNADVDASPPLTPEDHAKR